MIAIVGMIFTSCKKENEVAPTPVVTTQTNSNSNCGIGSSKRSIGTLPYYDFPSGIPNGGYTYYITYINSNNIAVEVKLYDPNKMEHPSDVYYQFNNFNVGQSYCFTQQYDGTYKMQ